ncbi:MAG: hypothetical protein V2A61_05080 [Calditrichota bacterium]
MIPLRKLIMCALVIVLAAAVQVPALEIFVWQHDNGLTVADPVLGGALTATQAVTRTLDQLRMSYTLDGALPDDIERYDVVITCLSFYCPG